MVSKKKRTFKTMNVFKGGGDLKVMRGSGMGMFFADGPLDFFQHN